MYLRGRWCWLRARHGNKFQYKDNVTIDSSLKAGVFASLQHAAPMERDRAKARWFFARGHIYQGEWLNDEQHGDEVYFSPASVNDSS